MSHRGGGQRLAGLGISMGEDATLGGDAVVGRGRRETPVWGEDAVVGKGRRQTPVWEEDRTPRNVGMGRERRAFRNSALAWLGMAEYEQQVGRQRRSRDVDTEHGQ